MRLPIRILPLVILLAATACTSESAPDVSNVSIPPPVMAIELGPECDESRRSACDELYKVQAFAVAWLTPKRSEGYVQTIDETPNGVKALRCLVREPDALMRLRHLVGHGTLAGQLYALAGLRALDQTEFLAVLDRFLSSAASVRISTEHLTNFVSVASLAQEIRSGAHVANLLPEFADDFAKPPSGVELAPPNS